jgi:LysM repeat protein
LSHRPLLRTVRTEFVLLPSRLGLVVMTGYTPTRAAARSPRAGSGKSSRRTLGALVVLAAVAMAHAPAVITVQPGDTLWDLARRHGTSVSELQRLNGMGGNATIYAGRTLTVPGGGGGGGGSSTGAVPTHNAGLKIPENVRSSVARHREILASQRVPTKAQARQMVHDTARRMGVDPSLALAVAYHESGFQQRVVSGVDAIGVMQVLPSTGRGLSKAIGRELDLLDTQDNITAGVLLLKRLVSSTGSAEKALAGYYQGLGSIRSRGVLPQTTAYIDNINALRPRFANG